MESSSQEQQSLRSTLGQGNPLPPPPEEREAILAFIKGDTALITSLKAEKLRRDIAVAQNESKAAMERACLLVLEADLTRARDFSDYVQTTITAATKFSNFTELEAQSARQSPVEWRSCIEALERAQISELTTISQVETLAMEAKAAEYVERASSAVQLHRQELQTANTLLIMAQRDMSRLSKQIKVFESSIEEKMFSLQAIWRVPDDVWMSIFAFSTGTSDGEAGINTKKLRDEAYWYGALVISAVCRRWRTIAAGCPRIWTKVAVVRGKFTDTTFPRIQHYLKFCKGMHRTILIDAASRLDDSHARLMMETSSLFRPLKRVVCILENRGSNTGTSAILKRLPFTSEVWLLMANRRSISSLLAPGYFVRIPISFGTALETMVTESVKVEWSGVGGNRIQLRSYTVDCPPIHSMWPIDLFSPSSISTLSTLRIRTTPRVILHAPPSQRVRLPNLKELHIPLNYLFSVVSRRFILPSLASITIVDAANTTLEEYEAFRPWLTSTKIQSIICESMGDVGPSATLISDLPSLSSLELRGETVSHVLSSLVMMAFRKLLAVMMVKASLGPSSLTSTVHDERKGAAPSSLKQLTIASYHGGGGPIISFLHRWKDQDKSLPHLRTLNVTILADECPGLSLGVRKEIVSLAGRRNRYESITHVMAEK